MSDNSRERETLFMLQNQTYLYQVKTGQEIYDDWSWYLHGPYSKKFKRDLDRYLKRQGYEE